MYVGDFEDLETKDIDEMIDEYGKTVGLANYFAVNAVNLLDGRGNWETVRDFILNELVNWIDE